MQFDLTDLPKITNERFLPLYLDKSRYLVLWGGAGGGKSYFAAQKILARVLVGMAKGRRHRFLCLRKTQPAARLSLFTLFNELIADWGIGGLVTTNKVSMTFSFSGGSQIIVGGLDDPEKLKSIVGVTGMWLEESTEFTEADFGEVDRRLRGRMPDYKQIILSFNPIDVRLWLKTHFFDSDAWQDISGDMAGTLRRKCEVVVDGVKETLLSTLHHTTYRDNQFIDTEYKVVLESLAKTDHYQHVVYNLGQWGELKGLIFTNWDIVDDWPAEQFVEHGYGLDFGYGGNPAACVEIGFVAENEPYLREILYEKGLTNQQLAGRLRPVMSEGVSVVADSAEPKSIAELRAAGLSVIPSIKGPDSVVYGIQRMQNYRMKVHRNSTNLIGEMQAYKWAEDKQGNALNKPAKFNDHAVDAARYAITRIKGVARQFLSFIDERPSTPAETPAETVDQRAFIDDEDIWADM